MQPRSRTQVVSLIINKQVENLKFNIFMIFSDAAQNKNTWTFGLLGEIYGFCSQQK